MFKRVLVANRGEIANRILLTLWKQQIESVAIFSDADAGAEYLGLATEAVRIGPAPARDSYLCIDKIVEVARRTGADAVHPGYGFLSENAKFAAALAAAGITFVGPPARAIEVMGDKIAAKTTVTQFGVPVVPGVARPGLSDAELIAAASGIGYPVLVKPSAGGGGKGMRMVEDPSDLPAALISARREAAAAFGDDTLFLERFVLRPRHIEVQILADTHGNVVHLGERECSLQRRHQKVIEEAPSPLLDAATRARIGAAACDTARSVDYVGAGTVEFIVSADRPDEFFFMEMNTRLQVEHPVTEMVTGLDLVEQQLRIAAGEALSFTQSDVQLRGHAVEARIYAEDPARDFLPTGGKVLAVHHGSGNRVRFDTGIYADMVVGSDYDPMLAKAIAHGDTRGEALARLDVALARTEVLGVVTNIEFLRFLLNDPDVLAGTLDTGLIDRRDFVPVDPLDTDFVAAAAFRWLRAQPAPGADIWDVPSGWRVGGQAPTTLRLAGGTRTEHVYLSGTAQRCTVRLESGGVYEISVSEQGPALTLFVDGHRQRYRVVEGDGHIWVVAGPAYFALTAVSGPDRQPHVAVLREVREANIRAGDEHAGDAEIVSPMPGSVIDIPVADGADVIAGTVVAVVEAMKMEHALRTPIDGKVELSVRAGDQVKVDQQLARIVRKDPS